MKEKYPELKDPCKTLIKKEICLGCNKLSDENFEKDENCQFVKEYKKERSD